MARAVQDTLRRGGHLFVEAGTGSGKTLAYLLPLLQFSAREDVRVVVSTDTRSLQSQILKNELPAVESLLGRGLRAEICLGAANYVCKRKLDLALRDGSLAADPGIDLADLNAWASASASGIREEYHGNVAARSWRQIVRNPDDCLASRCPNYSESFYFVARERWRQARLLIVNHSLLSAHLAVGGQLLPEFDALVVDEAHRLPETIVRSFTAEAGYKDMHDALLRRGPSAGVALQALDALLRELQSEMAGAGATRLRPRQSFSWPSLVALIEQLAALRKDLSFQLESTEREQELELGLPAEERGARQLKRLEIQTEIDRLAVYERLLGALGGGPRKNEAFWMEINSDRSDITMYLAPLESGEILAERLLDKCSVVFCSATLAASGADPFRFFRRESGLEALIQRGGRAGGELILDSPFDFPNRCLIYLPQRMPDPQDDQQFGEASAKICDALLQTTGGGAFLLYTSIRALEQGARLLRQLDPERELLLQTELGAARSLARFRETANGVLLGLATFWQGVDIPGDQLRLVVLMRIPFRPPDEPLLQARMERLREEGVDPFHELQIPQAALSLKQGFGRLLRRIEDRGAVAILDPRLRQRAYGARLLESLPPARPVHSLAEFQSAWKQLFG
ncbi:MAG: ATP-dependent DNA helicase [Leptospirales bacterium]|nr:ATP-dependent DNA helicase [Leptospirales bacterium]